VVKDERCCDQIDCADDGGEVSGCILRMTALQLVAVAVRRAGIDEASVEECLTGCVLREGCCEQAVAAVGLCRPDCRTAVSFR
jgi:hypothetical protein